MLILQAFRPAIELTKARKILESSHGATRWNFSSSYVMHKHFDRSRLILNEECQFHRLARKLEPSLIIALIATLRASDTGQSCSAVDGVHHTQARSTQHRGNRALHFTRARTGGSYFEPIFHGLDTTNKAVWWRYVWIRLKFLSAVHMTNALTSSTCCFLVGWYCFCLQVGEYTIYSPWFVSSTCMWPGELGWASEQTSALTCQFQTHRCIQLEWVTTRVCLVQAVR